MKKQNIILNTVLFVVLLLSSIISNSQTGCIAGNCKDGNGTFIDSLGNNYVGEWKEGKRNGQGVYIYDKVIYNPKGLYPELNAVPGKYCIYIGEWKDGKQNGHGIDSTYWGEVYKGEWKDGKKDGQGVLTGSGGKWSYSGEWKRGKRNGQGIDVFTGIQTYVGEWKGNQKNGKGTLTKVNGEIYEGEWKDGKMSGQGTMTSSDGRKYVGEWIDGKRNGNGTQSNINGDKYIGAFKDDKYNGKGTLKKADGSTIIVEWDEAVNEIAKKTSNTTQSSLSQQKEDNSKTVTLTQIGQGKTKDAAKYNALRNAIEKAFGTFISSNTTILNDALIKDEIVSISSGNIQSFEILSETLMPDGSYTSVVKATVSIGKLTTFCESKGIYVEFKGGLFAANIKLQELNKKNEEAVFSHLFSIMQMIVSNVFDYSIEASDPINYTYNNSYWLVPLKIKAKFNSNMTSLSILLENTIKSVSMDPTEVENYKKSNLTVYQLNFNGVSYYLRTSSAEFYLDYITTILIPLEVVNFKISNGINEQSWFDFCRCLQSSPGGQQKNISIYDYGKNGCYYANSPDKELLYLSYTACAKKKGWLSFVEIINDYNGYNISKYTNASLEHSKWDMPWFNFVLDANEITFTFSNFLTTTELSKVTQYKIQPLK